MDFWAFPRPMRKDLCGDIVRTMSLQRRREKRQSVKPLVKRKSETMSPNPTYKRSFGGDRPDRIGLAFKRQFDGHQPKTARILPNERRGNTARRSELGR
jgi:hypothetical protein